MHQGTNEAGQIYLPAVGGKLQGSVRGCLRSENKKRKQCTHIQRKRSYYLKEVTDCELPEKDRVVSNTVVSPMQRDGEGGL